MEFKPEVSWGHGRFAANFNVKKLRNGINRFVLGAAGQSILLLSSRFLKICQKKSPCLPAMLDFFWQGCLLFEVLHSETGWLSDRLP